jgi:hypothetical protein
MQANENLFENGAMSFLALIAGADAVAAPRARPPIAAIPLWRRGENGDYVVKRSAAGSDHPLAGLEDVFGAVTLPQDKTSLREKDRRRLAENNGHRRCGVA